MQVKLWAGPVSCISPDPRCLVAGSGDKHSMPLPVFVHEWIKVQVMQHSTLDTHHIVVMSKALKERLEHDDNLTKAFSIWSELDDLRARIFLAGKNLVVSLIYARMALNEETKCQICQNLSELLGGRCFNIISDLIDEFEGSDGDHHLWQMTKIGTYRVNN